MPKKVAEYLDAGKRMCLVRKYEDGTLVEASMASGPKGFALATFPGEDPVETEMPNVALATRAKLRSP